MADIPDGQDKHILISWIWDCAKTRKVHCVEQRHWAKESKVLRFQIEGAGYGEKIRRALEFVLTVETGLHSSERAALEAGWDGFCSGDCVDKKKTKEKKAIISCERKHLNGKLIWFILVNVFVMCSHSLSSSFSSSNTPFSMLLIWFSIRWLQGNTHIKIHCLSTYFKNKSRDIK